MPIDHIPILPADYPLFDWDDHLQSYYALGEGEPVAGFQKETWNAIIDKTLEALEAADMNWSNKYCSHSAAKVTQQYGALSAKMFNSVRHNIDLPASVGWGWANNPKLRGYVGREDFKGYADHGLNGDFFYAEYLLELVRRLNLMLSIMKGTANLSEMIAPTIAETESVKNLLALPSAPLAFSKPARSSFICGLMAKRVEQLAYMDKAKSLDKATAQMFQSRGLGGRQRTYSLQASALHMPVAYWIPRYSESIPSISQAAMDVFNALYLSSAYGLAHTTAKVVLAKPMSRNMGAEINSKARLSATQLSLPPEPIYATETAKTKTETTAHAARAVRTEAEDMGRASMAITFEKIRPRRMNVKVLARANCIATLDTAWLAPIWVNGKLYIRQAFETNRTDAVLEVK